MGTFALFLYLDVIMQAVDVIETFWMTPLSSPHD